MSITSLTNLINDYLYDLNETIINNQSRQRLWEEMTERQVEDLIKESGLQDLGNNDIFTLFKKSVNKIKSQNKPHNQLSFYMADLVDDLSEYNTDTEEVGQAKNGGIIIRRDYII